MIEVIAMDGVGLDALAASRNLRIRRARVLYYSEGRVGSA